VLYGRIALITTAMGGSAFHGTVARFFDAALVAEPRSEVVPVLLVEVPGGFRVEFAPLNALSVGSRSAALWPSAQPGRARGHIPRDRLRLIDPRDSQRPGSGSVDRESGGHPPRWPFGLSRPRCG
jgi:hypothetical protein